MIRPVFDDPNLVCAAGLAPVLLLAESAGFYDLLDDRLSVGSPNATLKATGVVAGMLTGADSIDDLDGLRHGAMEGLRAHVTRGASDWDAARTDAALVAARERGLIDE